MSTRPSPPAKPVGRQAMQLGQMLVKRGVLTPAQFEQALQHPLPPEQALVALGLASKRDVQAASAAAAGVPFVTLAASMAQPEAAARLPADFCNKHNVLPLMLAEDWLTVAVEDFGNMFLLEEIKRLSGRQVQLLAADGANIREVRQQVAGTSAPPPPAVSGAAGGADDSGAQAESDDAELEALTILSAQKAEPAEQDARDLEAAASGSPVIRLVNRIIATGIDSRASDIHIEPGDKEFRIRYRIDGELTADRLRPPIKLLPAIISRIKILASMDISERRLPQDGALTAVLSNRPVELRVSTMTTPLGEKAVMRIMDNSAGDRRLAELGFAPGLLDGLRRAISQPNGIVLVTGPTGSGKTTTLYAALSEIADEKLNFCSVEDPVEYTLKGVNQFQVNAKAGFTFAKALRSLLRQDPDVIMIGEIRDAETAKLATEAALTGHLVLSTLHTNDAPSALPRLVNMGVEPYLVAAAVRAVLAQRLVRRLCPHCRIERPLSEGIQRTLAEFNGGTPPISSAFQGQGCGRCRKTGYAGRTGLHELLVADEEMLTAAGRDMSLQSIRRLAAQRGIITLFQDAVEKVRAGAVGVDALFEVIGCGSVTEVYADGGPASTPAAA